MNVESVGLKKGSRTVTITHLFPVSIPKANISLFKVSISKECYLKVTLKSLNSLKEKVETSSVVPTGYLHHIDYNHDSKLLYRLD